LFRLSEGHLWLWEEVREATIQGFRSSGKRIGEVVDEGVPTGAKEEEFV